MLRMIKAALASYNSASLSCSSACDLHYLPKCESGAVCSFQGVCRCILILLEFGHGSLFCALVITGAFKMVFKRGLFIYIA